VMKALATRREDRYPTADAFRRALEQAADAAGLRHGLDELSGFVDEMVGEALKANEAAVMEAVERAKTQGFDEEGGRTDLDAIRGLVPSTTDTLPQAFIDEATASQMDGPPRSPSPLPQKPPPPKMLVPPHTTRKVALVALLARALGGTGAWLMSRRPALHGPVERVGWPPIIDPTVLAADVEPLRQHLERKTGHPVEFVYAHSYGELADQLLDGGVSFASLPAALFVRTEKRDPRVHPLALKLIGGSSGTDGVMLAAEGSNVTSLADLKGKRVCVPDDQSTTGMLFPRFAARRAGVDWEKDVTVVHSGTHLQVLRALASGKCEAGGTYQGAYVNAVTQGVDVSTLRQIAITGHTPQDVVVAGPAAPEKEAKAFQKALFSYAPPRDVESQASIERVSGFAPVKPEDFASLREMIASEDARQK